RLGLLFNAIAKIPMQFFILFIGAMVFVFYLFAEPPILFQSEELARLQNIAAFRPLEASYHQALDARRQAALAMVTAHKAGNTAAEAPETDQYRTAQSQIDDIGTAATAMVGSTGGEKNFSDVNYIFLTFVTRYLPAGLVGLVIAVIFAAAMSASAGEINSLAT